MSYKLSVVASNQAFYITVYLYIFSEYMCENSHVSLVMQFFQETINSLKFDVCAFYNREIMFKKLSFNFYNHSS